MNENSRISLKCIFCDIPHERIVCENKLAFAIYDAFPVTNLHMLVIPQRHIRNYFETTDEEVLAMNSLMHQLRREIMRSDQMVFGFNVGMNSGKEAGQTIFHSHIHLIPRRRGDVKNPRGGIRHVISDKGDY